MQHELTEIYQKCFPERQAEKELEALGKNFEYQILDKTTFIIYMVISPDEAEIIDIGTMPAMRGQGKATGLLKDTIENLSKKKIRTIYLEVAENNHTAIKLYEKCGFERYNIRKGYYKTATNRLNALLYKKSI